MVPQKSYSTGTHITRVYRSSSSPIIFCREQLLPFNFLGCKSRLIVRMDGFDLPSQSLWREKHREAWRPMDANEVDFMFFETVPFILKTFVGRKPGKTNPMLIKFFGKPGGFWLQFSVQGDSVLGNLHFLGSQLSDIKGCRWWEHQQYLSSPMKTDGAPLALSKKSWVPSYWVAEMVQPDHAV